MATLAKNLVRGFRYWASLARKIGLGLVLLSAVALGGCALDPAHDPTEVKPVGFLYNDAMDKLLASDFEAAATGFEELDRQHPFSAWAARSQLMSGYAWFLAKNHEEAILALDRFVELNPANRYAPYAYYLRGIVYYDRIDAIGLDSRRVREAQAALRQVVRRFPNTEYARDSAFKVDLTRSHLAANEMDVGRQYLKQGIYFAAIGRFRKIMDDFQDTALVPEALFRLVESYSALGLFEEARRNAAILGHNYPDGIWYTAAWDLLGRLGARDES